MVCGSTNTNQHDKWVRGEKVFCFVFFVQYLQSFFHASRKSFPLHNTSFDRPRHIFRKILSGIQHIFRGFLIQGRLRIGVQEQKQKPLTDLLDVNGRVPLIPQNVQTNVAFVVDVGMVHECAALDFCALERIVLWHIQVESEVPILPQAIRGSDGESQQENRVVVVVDFELAIRSSRQIEQLRKLSHEEFGGSFGAV